MGTATSGRKPRVVEDLFDRRDDLTAHHLEALAFVDRTTPLARQLELALEAIVAGNEDCGPMWRHLHNIAGGLLFELGRYERRHLPPAPEPAVERAVAA